MSAFEPAFLRAFPDLARLPRRPLLGEPTPVEPFPLDGVSPGRLWIKRDERSSVQHGGNKPRKLEFWLGRALERGARRLVTFGGLGTNHGLATTLLGRDAGLATTLVLLDQPMSPEVRESLLLQAAWGAEQVWGRNVPGTAAQALRVLARATWRGERPALIPPGGSGWPGSVGFVAAALELAEQVRAGACPEPSAVYVAVGTGGTVAGLAAGFALAKLPVRVVGVLVTDILPPSRWALARSANTLLRRLRHVDARVPKLALAPDAVELVIRQRGEAYGAATPAGRAAVVAARELGVVLEPTYTGKCLAEVLARAAEGTLGPGPAFFWNTYNAVDLRSGAPKPPDPSLLPPWLRARLAETAP